MKVIVAAIAAVLVATGCSSSGDGPLDQTVIAPKTSATAGHPNRLNHLSGYGATRPNWDANHNADPSRDLDAGCCYGPRIPFFGEDTLQDTWYAVLDADGLIYMFSHAFSPHTTEAQAVAAVVAKDLPPDAKRVRSVVGDGCKLFLYRSATVGRVAPTLGPYIVFDLVSPPDQTVYYPDNIWSASISTTGPTLPDC